MSDARRRVGISCHTDVRAVAERILDTPVGYGVEPVPPHFLGAVVVDQPLVLAGYVKTSLVVDGQQRLTTLQLLLDAAQLVTERYGPEIDVKALRVLVLNEPSIAANADEIYKVWPTDRDQDAFQAAKHPSDFLAKPGSTEEVPRSGSACTG